jgi:3-isopropylmalate/(R)-2-methylmalate dehydratase large subunit
MSTPSRTLYDKLWDAHVVHQDDDGTCLLYVDRHLLHEVTSPQAFEGLTQAHRKLWRISANLAVVDHNVPTTDRSHGIADPTSRLQVETLDHNARDFGVTYFDINDRRQGIVHVIGPEQGATLPGMTVVCGDSHTSTHGAFACLAFGIGTSEVEHALATQTIVAKKQRNMLVEVEGGLPRGVTSKDLVLSIIGQLGTAGGTGHAIEFAGSTIRSLSMEARMTICNMAIEAGARSGMVAVDDVTIDYLKGRPMAPKGALWDSAVAHWRTLRSDPGAKFDSVCPHRRARPQAACQLGHVAGDGCHHRRPGAGSGQGKGLGPPRRHGAGAGLHGVEAGNPDGSDRSRQGLHRLLHQLAHRRPATGGGSGQGQAQADSVKVAMVVPGSGLVKIQARPKGWTGSSATPASNGAIRVARCAWQ